MDFTDQVGALLAKLSEAYFQSSQLQKQRDEAFEKVAREAEILKSELESTQRKLLKTTLELESEREKLDNERQQLDYERKKVESEQKEREKARRLFLEAQAELSATQQKFSEVKNAATDANQIIKTLEEQLKYAKEEIAEKDEQIKEMEEFILGQENVKSDDSGSDVDLDFLSPDIGSRSASSKQFTLSPIPEENPDEIPYYYDAWWAGSSHNRPIFLFSSIPSIAYAEKLQIAIGSDSKSSMLSLSDADDSREVCAKPIAKPQPKSLISSTVSAGSEKENAPLKCKKKRKQFKVLFGLAHY